MTQTPILQICKDNEAGTDSLSPEVRTTGYFPELDVLELLSPRARERYLEWLAKR